MTVERKIELLEALQAPNRQQLEPMVQRLGFYEPSKSAANLCELVELLNDAQLLFSVMEDSLNSAEPDNALNYLERLFSTVAKTDLETILRNPERRQQLLTLLGGSPFLATILCRDADFFDHLFTQNEIDQRWSEQQMTEALGAMLTEGLSFEVLQQVLRRFKCRMIIRIGGRDLCGFAPLEEVTDELSSLASCTLQAAHDICRTLLDKEYGTPRIEEGPLTGKNPGFVVLGMGKFGGNELNFSSDIDLIYVYRTTRGQTDGIPAADGSVKNRIRLHQYFVKLGEMMARALNEATDDGFVFRVDLRLRPEGNSGELAQSLQATEDYYESWGRSWERAAMIKARPVAGDLLLGHELLQRLKPFIYRRHLDYAMVEDIKSMKQKIDATLKLSEESERNIKLGRGGIREIEFFAQAMQLINGGKQPELQQRNLLKTLEALHDLELIDDNEYQVLVDTNRMLRSVEHRVMIVHERQTHHLPEKEADQRALARRCGYPSWADFYQDLDQHRTAVQKIYHSLFYSPSEELEQKQDDSILHLFSPNTTDESVLAYFRSHGFESPSGALDSLRFFQGDSQHRPLTERGQRFLDRLGPILMTEVMNSNAPEKALVNLERFVRALRARSTFFALLAENQQIIHVLVELFSSSQFLSRIFCQHPETLDAMVSRAYAVNLKTRQEMAEELADLLRNTDDFGQQLDTLRHYRNEEFLRIALNDLNNEMSLEQSSNQLTFLAETILEQACSLARQELIPRFGIPVTESGEEAEFAVIGMGKMGGFELNYHSDLDIIFVYHGEGETSATEGTDAERFRQLSNHIYFAKLAQRIISALTLVTREGSAYEIDTQLRPSGNQGPLVTRFTAFKSYHQETAQPWERMALTKARVVVGAQELSQQLQQTIEQLAFDRPVPDNLAQEMVRLREKMENEIAREDRQRFNIKTGHGGMVDIEFIVQYLQLIHGQNLPEIRCKKTEEALQQMSKAGLMPPEQATELQQGYHFLRLMDRRLRLLHDQSTQELQTAGPDLTKLARLFGETYPEIDSGDAFLERYLEVTRAIRYTFNAILKS